MRVSYDTRRGPRSTRRRPCRHGPSKRHDSHKPWTKPRGPLTAYLGDTELQVSPGSTTVTGQRIYTANKTPVAVRTKAGISWLDTDPQGTSDTAENFATGAVTTRFFDPFGNPRGSAPTWPENDRGFLNKPTDPLSGLTTLGAREYAPQMGRFISVDPQLDLSDPQSLNGYAYADNDPVTNSDPTGQFCVLADGQCIKVGQTHTHEEYGVGDQGGNISRPMNDTQAAQWNGGYDPYQPAHHHRHTEHHSSGGGGLWGSIGHVVSGVASHAANYTNVGLHAAEHAGKMVGHIALDGLHATPGALKSTVNFVGRNLDNIAAGAAICSAWGVTAPVCGPVAVAAGLGGMVRHIYRWAKTGDTNELYDAASDGLFTGAGGFLGKFRALGNTAEPFAGVAMAWWRGGTVFLGALGIAVDIRLDHDR